MKAVCVHVYGGLEQLRYEEVPDPAYGPGEVLVRVKATALNHRDIWVRQGRPDARSRLPIIPGLDAAGVVEAVGPGVAGEWVGQKVMLHPNVSCGQCPACVSGQDENCPGYQVLGSSRDGGYAEYLAVSAASLIPMPAHLSFEEAASLPLVTLTAWRVLVTLCQVRPGEDVLIQAGGSGVGVILIQIAKLFGARAIVTAGSDEKLARAKKLGADEGINYETADFVAEVRRLTDGKGVDVVCEQVGGSVFERSLDALARGGRLATYGATIGGDVQFNVLKFTGRRIRVYFSAMGSKRDLLEAMPFIRDGRLRPVIDRVFPLREAAAAQQYMLDRRNFGKIVLRVGD